MENLKLKIDCTREHLEKAKWCRIGKDTSQVVSNCWIAVAVNKILPHSFVHNSVICNVSSIIFDNPNWNIILPFVARKAIREFDRCKTIEEREALEPFSFEIEIDHETLDKILEENGFDLKELEAIINKSDNLQLI